MKGRKYNKVDKLVEYINESEQLQAKGVGAGEFQWIDDRPSAKGQIRRGLTIMQDGETIYRTREDMPVGTGDAQRLVRYIEEGGKI